MLKTRNNCKIDSVTSPLWVSAFEEEVCTGPERPCKKCKYRVSNHTRNKQEKEKLSSHFPPYNSDCLDANLIFALEGNTLTKGEI